MAKKKKEIEIEIKEKQKLYPTDCRLDQGTKTFLSDKEVDAQMYNLLQCYSRTVSYKENGKEIKENRIYKDEMPNPSEMARLLAISKVDDDGNIVIKPRSRTTVYRHFNYLASSSPTNIYCPYLIPSEDGTYYTIPQPEKFYEKIPESMTQYLTNGFAPRAIKIYLYLLAKKRQLLKKGKTRCFFTIGELAVMLGINITDIRNYSYLWSRDPKKPGSIIVALDALTIGKLINYKNIEHGKNGHIWRELTFITTTVPTVPKENIIIHPSTPQSDADIDESEAIMKEMLSVDELKEINKINEEEAIDAHSLKT